MAKRKSYTTYAQSKKRKEFGLKERHHLFHLVDLLSKARPELNFEFIPSELDKPVPYDGLLHIKNSEGFIVKRIIIEAKVRTGDWPSYFLECQKYDNLKKLQIHHKDYLIWYVNFTPSNTIIFDLDTTAIGQPKTIQMNSQTFKSTTYKVPKPVYDLKVTEGQTINYSYKNNPFNE